MMKNFSKFTVCAFLMGTLSACSSFDAAILAQENGTYTAIAIDSDYKEALDNAIGKAKQVCKRQDGKAVVINYADEQKRKDDDHKITLLFRCEEED